MLAALCAATPRERPKMIFWHCLLTSLSFVAEKPVLSNSPILDNVAFLRMAAPWGVANRLIHGMHSKNSSSFFLQHFSPLADGN